MAFIDDDMPIPLGQGGDVVAPREGRQQRQVVPKRLLLPRDHPPGVDPNGSIEVYRVPPRLAEFQVSVYHQCQRVA
ncbi:hypothetical protein ACFFWC_31750, partial [Plantactinospora siamensis]|uniref:hypothetical protein n=1 Tax=Plantactinospora siamensis TaxID=555372 RepID=UPI0035EA5102